MSTQILATIPSPPQGVWHLGPVALRAYALCILTGIVVAVFWTVRRYVARGGYPETVIDCAIAAVPAGIIGGRIYHVITDHHLYFGEGRDWVDAFKITNGGLGIWGAVVLGGLAVWAVLAYKKVPLAPFADAVAPPILLAQAIGRLGNWFNQELYGGESDAPWALEIYRRVDADGNIDQMDGVSDGTVLATVQPTFLYEMVWSLLVVVLLVWADRRFRLGGGRVFMLYVAGYTFGRFFIELLRTDAATTVFGDVRINSVVSAVVFLAALTLFILTRSRTREEPEYVAGPPPEDQEGDGEGDTEPDAEAPEASGGSGGGGTGLSSDR
ncbi:MULTISPECIES: prolipoprotein diacylglyceryl transferase [unclassified Corynebacterium]|uniref:prolipoprotein diacylglyceryl transferase n=1 Tax=unclassified Corynebacterium TaxID=2624378 RepID=UPI00264835A5|nr:prolipoprotein diacylglyceryl transferase [Corynebacterium sp.]MDN5582726.1 prolipoprotein diacylglyceryl transferase [Corynebacterium sp.]MDN5718580.1 prolipoprotein diacylglyceryl transferase [Corynebacterium sp.]MDN6324524.1 prolipoprotein diacylglyceryl transferase [Corynebacterium sp.]